MRGRLSGRADGAQVVGLTGTQDILSEEKEENLVNEDIPDLPQDEEGGKGDITGFSDKLETSSRRLSHSHSEATLLDNSPEV